MARRRRRPSPFTPCGSASVPEAHPYLAGPRIVFGGNVLGWTVDRDRSFAVLDAFYEAGGRMIDTADGYSAWVPGHKGGESETVLGAWLESRGVRADMRIATKTGMGGAPGSLEPAKVLAAFDASMERLRTGYIDLYYVHRDDLTTPLEDVAGVYDSLFSAGKARELGVSNYAPDRFAALLNTCARLGTRPFTVLQNEYNLVARSHYEGAMQDLCVARGVAVLPFYGLASGFLTGKYRAASDWSGSQRDFALNACVAAGGWDVLAVLDDVAAETGATQAQIALAWLNTQPGIAAPLASATSVEQLRELMGAAAVVLGADQIARLTTAAR